MPLWSRLLKSDPIRGMQVWLDVDEDGAFTFRHEQASWREVIEHNKEYTKVNPKNVHAGNTQNHMVKAAEIPLTIWMWLKEQGIAQDAKRLKAWLNDPDNRHLRTYDGRL